MHGLIMMSCFLNSGGGGKKKKKKDTGSINQDVNDGVSNIDMDTSFPKLSGLVSKVHKNKGKILGADAKPLKPR